MSKAREIGKKQFEQDVLNSSRPVVIDFYASWCGPCQALMPTVESMAEKYEGEVDIVKINIDEEQELAEKYGVMSIPTLIFLRDGMEQSRVVGAPSRDKFEHLIDRLRAA